ncbi:MAG TPA: hypothetical protein DCM87_06435 [Planctomycetes bacterium]|nr:hypothetical protein [Planctomycetota bacterium]
MDSDTNSNGSMRRRHSTIPGFALAFLLLVGIAGIVLTYVALAYEEWVGAGVFLTASAVAFGFAVNAFFRR